VNTLLHNKSTPLLLAGVDSEVAIYRRVTTYPRLLPAFVNGSPDGVPDPELHKRAVEIVMQFRGRALEKALDDFNTHRDGRRLSFDPRGIIKAAFEGRVEDLLFLESDEIRGSWNEQTHEIDKSNSQEDLLNAAALQTILHRGRAFALTANDMPESRNVAAVLRFQVV